MGQREKQDREGSEIVKERDIVRSERERDRDRFSSERGERVSSE